MVKNHIGWADGCVIAHCCLVICVKVDPYYLGLTFKLLGELDDLRFHLIAAMAGEINTEFNQHGLAALSNERLKFRTRNHWHDTGFALPFRCSIAFEFAVFAVSFVSTGGA